MKSEGKFLVDWRLLTCICVGFWVGSAGLVSAGGYGPAADSATVLVWNLENWFDPVYRPPYDDPAFTPRGEKHWTWERFRQKRNRIVRTLLSVEGRWGQLPDVVACCEVENAWVLHALLDETVLSKADYAVVHHEGQDPRGIECGLLYRTSVWTLVSSRAVQSVPEGKPLRPILYACLQEQTSGRYCHFFVNHWPSKRGGTSDRGRIRAGDALLGAVDSVLREDPGAWVLAVGDFNDGVQAAALRRLAPRMQPILPGVAGARTGVEGSVRYRGRWDLIDLVLVPKAGPLAPKAWVFAPDQLLEEDPRWLGVRPLRTYVGPRFVGGVSDHLPIVVRFPKNT